MGFSTSDLVAWVEQPVNPADFILKPILANRTFDIIKDVRYNIMGQNVNLPTMDNTAYAQSGTSCGFSTSGSTSLGKVVITTSSIKSEESWCLEDLRTFAHQQLLQNSDIPETGQIMNMIIERKLAKISRKFGSMLWQGKTTYGNDTWLKQINGFCSTIDSASDEVVATATANITTANVLGIVDEMIFTKALTIPDAFGEAPIIVMGQDTFMLLVYALKALNYFHIPLNAGATESFTMTYPGTNIKIYGLAELNASNTTETGSLPAAVQDRIFMTYPSNFIIGLNVGEGDYKVWYSADDELVKFRWRCHAGVQVKHTDLVVSYANS